MDQTIHVKVESIHIAQGTPLSPSGCPVALAVRSQVAGVTEIFVDQTGVYMTTTKEKAYHKYLVPRYVSKFISQFDNSRYTCQIIDPIEFDMTLCDLEGWKQI
jgi:hypothetical protein